MEDYRDFSSRSRPPSTRKELQGPRPTPLKVSKDSHKIKKPPVAPAPRPHQNQPPQFLPRPPVIIYTVSPKVIHTNPADFMALVQRLTGSDSTAPSSSGATYGSVGDRGAAGGDGGISPAARFASIEKTKLSPEDKKKLQHISHMGTITDHDGIMIDIDHELESLSGGGGGGGFLGILSPGPGSLPPIQPNLFSPPSDRNTIASTLFNDSGSPRVVQVQHGSRTSYMVSPSAAHFFSPSSIMFSPASLDILRNLFD
ncbi:hypothetical protein Dimus_035278 [Dionaea muscipula]